MNTLVREPDTKTDPRIVLRIAIIVVLSLILAFLIFYPGFGSWGELGPAPTLTGKVISVTPATAQEKAQDNTRLGTILVQRNDGYQLLLRVYHAEGNGCFGSNTLHLSDITVGENVTVRYWLDTPDSATNPHKGHAVYVNARC